MGRKIFVSYKYADSNVENLTYYLNSTVKDYVTEFQNILDHSDHIYKGEGEDEDLSYLDDDTIWEKLRNRIYDSTVTVIFISPEMRETWKQDRDQWIPWEISYSLKETSRKNSNGEPVISHSNALLAVVLPDASGSYDYFVRDNSCCGSHCRTIFRDNAFRIICENMFNIKQPDTSICSDGRTIWHGDSSYISIVKWSDFKSNYNKYINQACDIQADIDSYDIRKEV